MNNINIKITNAKELIKVLEDINDRAYQQRTLQYGTNFEAYLVYKSSLKTLIAALKAAK